MNVDVRKAEMTRDQTTAQIQENYWQLWREEGPTPKQAIRLLEKLMRAKETKFVKVKKAFEIERDEEENIIGLQIERVKLPTTPTGRPKKGLRVVVETNIEAQIGVDVEALGVQQQALRDYFNLVGLKAPGRLELVGDAELMETLRQVVGKADGKTTGLPKNREML